MERYRGAGGKLEELGGAGTLPGERPFAPAGRPGVVARRGGRPSGGERRRMDSRGGRCEAAGVWLWNCVAWGAWGAWGVDVRGA